ncbi:MAG: response regulator [Desulfobulbaceae bacterium]|nr:response regulator [Desulfobulbaceae bacterium]
MGGEKILVVDDEEQIRKMFGHALSEAGYQVQTAESAEQALQLMHESPSWVVFLDLNLPGMNGVELCEQIRKDWPMAIPIAVTGYASLFELSECRTAGFEDYFTKPAEISGILEAAAYAFTKLKRWKKR